MSGTNGALDQLKVAFAEINSINSAVAVLNWDQQTYMPPGGAAGRAEDLAALQRIAHERLTNPRIGELIAQAREAAAGLDPDSDEAALVRIAQRDYEEAVKLPDDLGAGLARTAARADGVA